MNIDDVVFSVIPNEGRYGWGDNILVATVVDPVHGEVTGEQVFPGDTPRQDEYNNDFLEAINSLQNNLEYLGLALSREGTSDFDHTHYSSKVGICTSDGVGHTHDL